MSSTEDRCVAPGQWVIDGFDVIRRRPMGDGVYWQIRIGKKVIASKRKLADCRDLIANHRDYLERRVEETK